MKWDVMGLREVRRKEESFTTLHMLYHSEANNGQAGGGFLVNKTWKDNITRVSSGNSRVAELVLRITDRSQLKIVQVYACYFPKITFPTRFSRTTGTLIDNFFCKLTRTTFDITSGILTKSFSDHQPYFIFLNCENTSKKPPNTFIQIRSHNETSFINVEKELQSYNVISLMDNNVTSDPNDNYNILLEELKKAIDKHMPMKTVKFDKYRHKKETWITSGILKSKI